MTLVGEEGLNLSGGQKQWVGIMRTLFQKLQILLLLEIGLLIYVFISKDVNYSSWGDFFAGPLFLNSIITLSISVQAWRAYKEMEKIQEGMINKFTDRI